MFQGKTVVQAEIDAAAELIDFFRFNAKHAIELQEQQPLDGEGSTNTMLYRGLEVRGHSPSRLCSPDATHPPLYFLRASLLLWRLLTSPRSAGTWQERQL